MIWCFNKCIFEITHRGMFISNLKSLSLTGVKTPKVTSELAATNDTSVYILTYWGRKMA